MTNNFLVSTIFVACLLTQRQQSVDSFAVESPLPKAAFVGAITKFPPTAPTAIVLFSATDDDDDGGDGDGEGGDHGEAPPKLIFDAAEVQERMAKLKSKYPTSEADYLAAARKRAEMKVESKNDDSTLEDWQRLAAEKQQKQSAGNGGGGGSGGGGGGDYPVEDDGDDDWEASLKEAGNEDSQILIPVELDGGDDEEPKLLL